MKELKRVAKYLQARAYATRNAKDDAEEMNYWAALRIVMWLMVPDNVEEYAGDLV